MRSFRTLPIALTALLIIGHSEGVRAQSAPPACTYATCALRVEPVFLGMALVRGAAGDSAVRLNGFGRGVEPLLAGPDSAAAYARTYISANKTSSVLGLVAVASYIFVMVHTDHFRSDATGADVAVGVAGVGAAVAGIPFVLRSQRSLSRAVWWYNAALPR